MKPFITHEAARVKLPAKLIRKYGSPKNHGVAAKQRAVCKWRSRKGARRAGKMNLQND